MEKMPPLGLSWKIPGALQETTREQLRRELSSSFSDETRTQQQYVPDWYVHTQISPDGYQIQLCPIDAEGWPATSRTWLETRIQSALLPEGIVLGAGSE